MKKILTILIILMSVNIAIAQNASNKTTIPSPNAFKGIYSFLVTANPIVLLILGGVLIIVSKFAKWIGIILVIIGLIHLLFLFIG